MRRHHLTITFCALALPLGLSGTASAATYRVAQCGSTTSSHEFIGGSNTPAMYVVDKCSSTSGLSIQGVAGAHAALNSGAGWSAYAPPGTTFSDWEAGFQSGAGNSQGIVPYARACYTTTCAGSIDYLFFGPQQNWGKPVTKRWQGSGAVLLQFLVQCMSIFSGVSSCDMGSNPAGGDLYVPEMTLDDHHVPSSPRLTGGNLPGAGWESGRKPHSISFAASDQGGGIDFVTASIEGGPSVTHPAPCARSGSVYNRLQPCPLAVNGSLSIDLSSLSDGTHDMRLTAVDAAGQTSTDNARPIHVDNTAPAAPQHLALVGGEAWKSRDGFAATWQSPVQSHAPIVATRWRLCPVATGPCHSGRQAGSASSLNDIAALNSGEYSLYAWLEDAAENQDSATAAKVTLRLDTEAPRLAFLDQQPADPLTVEVNVADRFSGLAGGEIELRKAGTTTWRTLDTTVEGDRLRASVDDGAYEAGGYELRATAADKAGNTATTDLRANGSPAHLQLPARATTRLRVGVQTRPSEKQRTIRLRRSVRVKSGQSVALEGTLTSASGTPLADASVRVYSTTRYTDQPFRSIGIVHTDPTGRFFYQARVRKSTLLRFDYAGSPQVKGAAADVVLGKVAASTMAASDRSVRNGQSVKFQGRLKTRPVPEGGKLIEIQAFFRDRWRTFSTVRTDASGRWSFDYLFGGTIGRVLYRFRIRMPHEGGYAFETGTSPVTRVVVRGPAPS
jgi:hypothetical protein